MKTILFFIILSFLNISCSRGLREYQGYNPPENLNDGLKVGTLKEAGIDSGKILKATQKIQEGKFGEIHSLLIYKDNMLAFEEYYAGHEYKWDAPGYQSEWVQWDKTMLHQIMSCTKSVTSACIGIAVDKGYIKNVHQSIFDYLPNYSQYKTNGRENIAIEHLLTMTSGLQWDEWHAPHATAANDIDRLYIECYEDPLSCVLERPLVSAPGEAFTYNGGGMIVLGEILRNAAGMNIVEFSKKFIFEPLGIDTFRWDGFPNGIIETGGGLLLRPRDMMKFGVTYLNDGIWNDNRIISSDWVQKSSTIYGNNRKINLPIEDSGKNGYGYTWWISEVGKYGKKTKMYRANGWGGQVIMILPEKNTVIVFTCGNYTSRSKLFKILDKYLLPAVTD